MAKGRPFSANALFRQDKPWRKYVTDFCLKELGGQFSWSGPERSCRRNGRGGRRKLVVCQRPCGVHFTVYSIASFSGGEYDVEIPYKRLKPYLKTGH
jgi:hypothetical protein